jgi:glutaredoxin
LQERYRAVRDGENIMRNVVLLVVISLLCALSAAAGVYKWTDSDGRVHYSDSPPENAKARKVDAKINTIKLPAVVSAAPANEESAQRARVRMFTTAWCGYCNKARAYLRARGTPFQDLDVETSATAKAEFDSIGGKGVPVIFAGNQRMDGYSEKRLEQMLKTAGL